MPDSTDILPTLPAGVAPRREEAPAALEVRSLRKLFRDVRAVDDVSFLVRPGEIVGLVGPNGAGKTTTLRCLAGVVPATSGEIRVAGHALAVEPVPAKRALAFLPDEPRLFDHLTVREHLNFVARMYGVADWDRKARALLAELDFEGRDDELPSELSRGMKQKLSIACGFLHDPRVVLLDEPLTGLDPMGMRRMKGSLAGRARAGAAILLSSHLLTLVEELCGRVLVLDRGRLVAGGSLDEIRGRFAGAADASLEELFVAITAGGRGA